MSKTKNNRGFFWVSILLFFITFACKGEGTIQTSPGTGLEGENPDGSIVLNDKTGGAEGAGYGNQIALKDQEDPAGVLGAQGSGSPATDGGTKYFKIREGVPTIDFQTNPTYQRANCPDDAKIVEGSNDTAGTLQVPNLQTNITDFSCTIKFSAPYSKAPICVLTGTGFAQSAEMTFKVHSVAKEFLEVKGLNPNGTGAALHVNYICLESVP